ncbi:Pyrroline-5-carboxylate reductase [Alternaria arborescens]|nr:Pyrroline-5-carboxylate reductase [Alternaria arborescens]KAH6852315.1 pyrroline-5-carboxylate reductase dimerization-domain-containing protein [Alternaria alternata]RYN57234.1 Pyrroline-5-carboxylate reductase [Alternaria tenuissima]OWY41747.1 pyrroline-5-carboxylate reductase [Alternaria alternata]RYN21967.1 Pyrroline-5-carboxylate reductase [Alternaria arborescens]RYN65085.1 Pyrroline-5-carboxylate reductase [Alternaria tenuissima]
MASAQESKPLTLTVLGSGTMGIAIMGGVMSSLASAKTKASLDPSSAPKDVPNLSNFIACDQWAPAEQNVRKALGHYNFPLQTLTNQNLKGVQEADIVLLSCKPHGFKTILGEEGVREALKGKVLVSILAGVTREQIEAFLYPDGPEKTENACRVVRVMPNTASFVGESMSVIQTSDPPLSEAQYKLVEFVFSSIGRVTNLPPANMDAATALCGSGPAFFALILEAAADGAVAMGLPRAEAQMMAAQTMRGTTGLVLNGEHPAVLKDKVSTPGGCTIGGLMSLEEDGVRGAVAKAIREATVVASRLGGEQKEFVNHRR